MLVEIVKPEYVQEVNWETARQTASRGRRRSAGPRRRHTSPRAPSIKPRSDTTHHPPKPELESNNPRNSEADPKNRERHCLHSASLTPRPPPKPSLICGRRNSSAPLPCRLVNARSRGLATVGAGVSVSLYDDHVAARVGNLITRAVALSSGHFFFFWNGYTAFKKRKKKKRSDV